MADVVSTVAAAGVGASSALATNLPPALVVVCAAGGAIIHVWVSHSKDFALSVRWVTMACGLVLAYLAFGVIGSTFIAFGLLGANLAAMPTWATAAALSLTAGVLLPILKKRVKEEGEK
jgi:hypothetical protein